MALVKYNDRSLRNLTTAPAAVTGNSPGAIVHIKTLTASSSATLSFIDGTDSVVLDNTYPIYKFEFISIHPNGDDRKFLMQGNTAGASGFNETITSTYFRAYHKEDGSAAVLSYEDGQDLAQSTSAHELIDSLGTDNDQAMSGEMFLFNPSSTTFVKHFMSNCSNAHAGNFAHNVYTAGYFNTTSAIDEIQFSTNTGSFETGTIKLYGIKDS
tara:strand:+ start:431 stop:1066 length:636 start_codon:yes stop_codon:yes gene_type:complete